MVTVSNVLYTKACSSGVARHFDWADQKHGYSALLMNLKRNIHKVTSFCYTGPRVPPGYALTYSSLSKVEF